MLKKNLFEKLPLFLLIAAIGLSPSFNFGTVPGLEKIIEIRIEDLLLVVLILIWLGGFLAAGRSRVEKAPLFFPILFWLGIGLLSLLANVILANVNLSRGFFYFLKEIEIFLIYFYVFYHIKDSRQAKSLVKFWILLAATNIFYVIYQIIFGKQRGEYGTAAISEWGVFPTGAFFLLIFIFLINFYFYSLSGEIKSKFNKILLGLVAFSPAIGVFGSLSRTDILGLVFALCLTIFLLLLRKKTKKVLLFGLLMFIIFSVFIFSFSKFHSADRLFKILTIQDIYHGFEGGRLKAVIVPQFQEALRHPFLPILGMGKGAVLVLQESHNQYLRNFIETGIIGSFAFLLLIFVILQKSLTGFLKKQDYFSVGMSAGLFIATLTMLFLSLAVEAFMVVKPSEVFWFFAAIAMASLNFSKKEKIEFKK